MSRSTSNRAWFFCASTVLFGCGGGGAPQSGTGGSGLPVCRALTQTCAVTTDCCDPLICLENLCVQRPTGTGGAGGSAGAAGPVPGTGGAGAMCRGATQACANSADCCPSLICTSNMCLAPPSCRAAAATCAVTADCCNPLICLGNVCQAAPTDTCGDGRCTGTESTATCCRDCGCPTGTTCNGTSCVNVGVSTMTWNVTNSCANGEAIELRFFDVTNLMVWPDNLSQVYTVGQGETRSHPLACTTGATICFGADQPQHALFWGLDIDATQPCDACCALCANTTVAQSLTCN